MGGIEPGTPIITATLTYLARVKIGWMLYPFITKVGFTDNIHQGQNRSHSKYILDNIRGQTSIKSLRYTWAFLGRTL